MVVEISEKESFKKKFSPLKITIFKTNYVTNYWELQYATIIKNVLSIVILKFVYVNW